MTRVVDIAAHHGDRRPFLVLRARLLSAVRTWFMDRGFLEADVGALVVSPGAEVHTHAFQAGENYLHTSPEFAMKRLLAAGEENIFFLGKVYRAGETGRLHSPEFTMIEWYRPHEPYTAVMEDCIGLTRLAARTCRSEKLMFGNRTCNPFAEPDRISVDEAFHRVGESPPADPDAFSAVLATRVEPTLGAPALTVLDAYPATQAALARPTPHDPTTVERFELYACGVELANGYGELVGADAYSTRLNAAMAEKERRYGERWPVDPDFIEAMDAMPPASGCAMGFDRLLMLAAGAPSVGSVLW